MYVLLVGYPPFANDNQMALFQSIRTADYKFNEEDWEGISPSAQDLIRNLLTVDPSKRMTAKQALYESEWLKDKDEKRMSAKELSSSVTEIRKQRRLSLKCIAKAVMWSQRSSSAFNVDPGEDGDNGDQQGQKNE